MSTTGISVTAYKKKKLTAIGKFGDSDLGKRILDRIKGTKRSTQAGSYVMADSERFVYILPDGHYAVEWVQRFPAMFVGLYGTHWMPRAEDIVGDLESHLNPRTSV